MTDKTNVCSATPKSRKLSGDELLHHIMEAFLATPQFATSERFDAYDQLKVLLSVPSERGDSERLDFAEQKAATIYCSESGHWVFVDERNKTRQGVIGAEGIRSCIDAAMKGEK